MFRAKNNTGRALVATMALVATCPALTQAAEDAPAADSAAPDAGAPAGVADAASANNSSDPTSEIVVSAQS